jgi:tetratricopeptide (TPR) repeat protein
MKKYLIISILVFISIWISCKNDKTNINSTTIMNSKDSIHIKIAKINELINQNPKSADLYNDRALLYIEKQSFDSAFVDIRKALLIDSSKSNYFCTLSDVYFANGKVDKSSQALSKALLLDPKNNEAYLKLAEIYFILKNFDKCFENLNKSVELEKLNPKAYFIQGMAFKQMGDTAKAISSMQTVVEQDPGYYDAYIQLGLMHAEHHNKLAIDYYNNALRIDPQSIEALYNLGMFYQENDMIDNAIISYNSILKIEPKNKYANYNIGYIYLVYLNKFKEAINYFSEALKIDPKYTEAYYNRGLCYEMLGDYTNARADYHNATNITPNFENAVIGLNRLDNNK